MSSVQEGDRQCAVVIRRFRSASAGLDDSSSRSSNSDGDAADHSRRGRERRPQHSLISETASSSTGEVARVAETPPHGVAAGPTPSAMPRPVSSDTAQRITSLSSSSLEIISPPSPGHTRRTIPPIDSSSNTSSTASAGGSLRGRCKSLFHHHHHQHRRSIASTERDSDGGVARGLSAANTSAPADAAPSLDGGFQDSFGLPAAPQPTTAPPSTNDREGFMGRGGDRANFFEGAAPSAFVYRKPSSPCVDNSLSTAATTVNVADAATDTTGVRALEKVMSAVSSEAQLVHLSKVRQMPALAYVPVTAETTSRLLPASTELDPSSSADEPTGVRARDSAQSTRAEAAVEADPCISAPGPPRNETFSPPHLVAHARGELVRTDVVVGVVDNDGLSGSPTPSGPGGLAYNRVGIQGRGSVPFAVLETSRAKRRPLPVERDASSAAPDRRSTGRGVQSIHLRNIATAARDLAEGAPPFTTASTTTATDLSSAQSLLAPVLSARPLRQAPRQPGPTNRAPALTFIEDDEVSPGPEGALTTSPRGENLGAGSLDDPSLQSLRLSSVAAVSESPSSPISTFPTAPRDASAVEEKSRSPVSHASLRRQQEAALVVYDDRVPPAERYVGKQKRMRMRSMAGKGTPHAADADPVAAWLLRGLRPSTAESAKGSIEGWQNSRAVLRAPVHRPGIGWDTPNVSVDGEELAESHRDDGRIDLELKSPEGKDSTEAGAAFSPLRRWQQSSSSSPSHRLWASPSATLPAYAELRHATDATVEQLLSSYNDPWKQRRAGDRPLPKSSCVRRLGGGKQELAVHSDIGLGRSRHSTPHDTTLSLTPTATVAREATLLAEGSVDDQLASSVDLLHYRSSRSKHPRSR